jgi:hypothetical protein
MPRSGREREELLPAARIVADLAERAICAVMRSWICRSVANPVMLLPATGPARPPAYPRCA